MLFRRARASWEIGRTTCLAEKALHWHLFDENSFDVQSKRFDA
jgi:hypothetical protein